MQGKMSGGLFIRLKVRRGQDWRKAAIRVLKNRIRQLKNEMKAEKEALKRMEKVKNQAEPRRYPCTV